MPENEFEKRQLLREEFQGMEREIDKRKRTLLRLERYRKKQKVQLVKSFFAALVCLCLCVFFVIINNAIYAVSFFVAFLFFLLIRFPYLCLRYLADSGVKGVRRIFFKNNAYCYVNEKQENIVELVELEARREVLREKSIMQ